MHKCLLNAAMPLLLAAAGVFPAAAQQPDSLQVEQLQEVVIGAVRAAKDAPFAVANIQRAELQDFSATGIELPMLFARTPGILAWSENGVGTGTSYMRIRGAGGSRINVTLDGVPLNSPEDQTVFWANMNSYGSLMGSVQIQRGVGASTNGDGAFGGTIALGTKAPSLVPTAELNASYGSWNTMNLGVTASTGHGPSLEPPRPGGRLPPDHDGRLSARYQRTLRQLVRQPELAGPQLETVLQAAG